MNAPISVVCPKCEKPVLAVRAGTYGWQGQRRQMLKCKVCSYRFAEPLPRAVVVIDETCIECLNPLGKHQGQPHPRGYHYPIRVVSQALVAAAKAGDANSYRAVGERVRKLLGRVRYNKKRVEKPAPEGDATTEDSSAVAAKKKRRGSGPPERQSSTLIADWVEAVGPVLWKEHGPRIWPEIIAIDELDIRGRSAKTAAKSKLMFPESSKPDPNPDPDDIEPSGLDLLGSDETDEEPETTHAPKKRGGRRLFVIMGAEGYPRGERAAPWLYQAAPSGTKEAWLGFFGALDGRPKIIVGDAAYAWQEAARLAWPAPNTPELLVSEFHLARMLDGHLKRLHLRDDKALNEANSAAFRGPRQWALFMALLTPIALTDEKLERWLRRWESRIAAQLASQAQRTVTKTTGGIEQRLLRVKARIEPRRWLFANRERMNRLLMLICLDMRDGANERDWAKTIRAYLVRLGGRPGKQRQIWDKGGLDPGGRKGLSSLRYKNVPADS